MVAPESDAPLSNVGMFLASPVGRVMRSDVALLEADMTAEDALQAMQEKKARNVLVSTKGEVVGIVSKTDILFGDFRRKRPFKGKAKRNHD